MKTKGQVPAAKEAVWRNAASFTRNNAILRKTKKQGRGRQEVGKASVAASRLSVEPALWRQDTNSHLPLGLHVQHAVEQLPVVGPHPRIGALRRHQPKVRHSAGAAGRVVLCWEVTSA